MIPSKTPPPGRPDTRPLILLLIVIALLASMAWTAQRPVTSAAQQTQPVPSDLVNTVQVTPTPARFPEHLTNQDQTNGIILGSTILVLIIVIGTLTVIRHGERHSG